MQNALDTTLYKCNQQWISYINQVLFKLALKKNTILFSFVTKATIVDGGVFKNNILYRRVRHALIFQINNSLYQIVRQMTDNLLVEWNIYHISGDELDFCHHTPKLYTFFALDTKDYSQLIDCLEASPFKKIAKKINNEDCV
jgi:hypothetical protein